MTIRYEWRSGARISIDAQRAGEAIDLLRDRTNGPLTPRMVVDAARPAASVLHPAFEWDDAVAAEQHRESQARYLLGSIVVRVQPRGVPEAKRAFVSVELPDAVPSYEPRHRVLSDAELRSQVIRQGWTDLDAWVAKYGEFSDFDGVTEAIAAARR